MNDFCDVCGSENLAESDTYRPGDGEPLVTVYTCEDCGNEMHIDHEYEPEPR